MSNSLNEKYQLPEFPPIEAVAFKVHERWMMQKQIQGVTSRKAEDGEELMVPYDQLSEKAKELYRASVRAVYAAIRETAGWPEPEA